jgi:hypothetical protein
MEFRTMHQSWVPTIYHSPTVKIPHSIADSVKTSGRGKNDTNTLILKSDYGVSASKTCDSELERRKNQRKLSLISLASKGVDRRELLQRGRFSPLP